MGNVEVQSKQEYCCPKHPDVPLWGVLKGGSGFCRSCDFYVQAAGVPMPTLPPKPEQVKTKAKGKAKKKAAPKRKQKAAPRQSDGLKPKRRRMMIEITTNI